MDDEPLPGVQLLPPPLERLAPITDAIAKAVANLPAGAKGGLIGVANNEGMNIAVVHRFTEGFAVVGWIGSKWGGSLDYGAAARVTW